MIVALVILAACNAAKESDVARDRRVQVITSLAEHAALERYRDFERRAGTLSDRATALCEAPSSDGLIAAREAWWSAREPWKRTEVVLFGPVVEYPERLGPKLDDWPVNAAAVEALLAGTGALDQAAFEAMGTATRGLPVSEYLLWARGDSTLAALETEPRRCACLAGAAADVHANARRLVVAWETKWVSRVGEPDTATDDAFDNPQDVVDEWVNRMVFTVENVSHEKLGKPVGDSSGGEPQLDAIESRYSARSLTDARDALVGANEVWTGDIGGQHPGIADLVAGDPELISRVDLLFGDASTRLVQVPETLETTVVSEPEIVARAQEGLQALQVALQVDLAQALGVTITFNDNDGD